MVDGLDIDLRVVEVVRLCFDPEKSLLAGDVVFACFEVFFEKFIVDLGDYAGHYGIDILVEKFGL